MTGNVTMKTSLAQNLRVKNFQQEIYYLMYICIVQRKGKSHPEKWRHVFLLFSWIPVTKLITGKDNLGLGFRAIDNMCCFKPWEVKNKKWVNYNQGCNGPFESKDANQGAMLNLELYFAGREWLVLHHNCAAAGQDHDVQLLLLLMGLLIPLTGHFCVMSRYQCYLQ